MTYSFPHSMLPRVQNLGLRRTGHRGTGRLGFTLVEVMVSISVLAILLGVIFTLTQQTAKVYKDTGGKMESFRAARNAFESMTRNLSLATLNNYYDYVDVNGVTRGQLIRNGDTAAIKQFSPTTYARTSDMHFVSGWSSGPGSLYSKQVTHSIFFQAPLGYASVTNLSNLENLVNACGYYVEYRADTDKPGFVSSTPVYRYCLMEFIEPSEKLTVYTTSDTKWFTDPLARDPLGSNPPPVHQLAPNIIGLFIRPRSSGADAVSLSTDPVVTAIADYQYDTRANTAKAIHNQLPPILEIVMVAIDEVSAARLQPNTAAQPGIIQTALTANNRFKKSADLDADLDLLEKDLVANHINYRVFQTLVPLRNSKWSSQ